jgi:hypothetical protein
MSPQHVVELPPVFEDPVFPLRGQNDQLYRNGWEIGDDVAQFLHLVTRSMRAARRLGIRLARIGQCAAFATCATTLKPAGVKHRARHDQSGRVEGLVAVIA